MVTDTKTRIISYIRTNGQARVKDLVNHLGFGPVAIHRHLKSLIDKGELVKAGTPPKVSYQLPPDSLVRLDQRQLKDICRRYKVEFLGMFGSATRRDYRIDSDIDLLVRFSPKTKVSFFELVNLEEDLTDLVGKKVDLVPDGGVSPYIEPYIKKNLVKIYG